MKIFSKKFFSRILTVAILINSFVTSNSLAADSASFSTLKMNTAANHTFTFVIPGEVTAGNSIVVTYPADFALTSLDYTDIDLSDDGAPLTMAASPLTTNWGVTVTPGARTITITSGTGTIAASSVMILKVGTHAAVGTAGTHQATNPTTANTYSITIAAGGSTAYMAVSIVSNDQVALSAVVGQTLSFSISDNSIGFGTLSTDAPSYATGDAVGTTVETSAHTITASTNAGSGYTITVLGDTLEAGVESIAAIGGTAAALAAGSAQFGLRATAAGGSGAVSSPYASADYAYAAIASATDEVAASVSASAATTYTVYYGASISSQTEPGSYSTTLTYTIAANY